MDHTGTTYKSLSDNEHVRLRSSMYIGSKKSTNNTLWLYNNDTKLMNKETLQYPIALYNCCDEIILNAIDHCTRTYKLKGKGKCNTIKVSFDKSNGLISCFNNGEGIVVEKNEEGQFIPEMIFTKVRSGSNFENGKGKKLVGLNGYGSSLVNILSNYFRIETNDLKNKKHYIQEYENGNTIIKEPIINKGLKDPFTKVDFILDFEYFEVEYNSNLIDIIDKLLRTRMIYVSACLGESYKIYYQDEELKIYNLEELAKITPAYIETEQMVKCNLTKGKDKFEIIIFVWDNNEGNEHLSFINGLYLSEGGTHIRYISKLILDNLKKKLEKKLKDKIKITNKLISNFLFIMFKGDMDELEYKNQSKNELSIPESRFKDYIFQNSVYNNIWELLEEKIDTIYLNKISKNNTTKKTSKLTGIKKYKGAEYAGTAKSQQCSLFIPEGDSAESCIKNGLTSNSSLGFKYNGIFNIQGVPLNVRKEVEIKEFTKNGKLEKIIDKKKKLIENERFNSLVKVLNLNWHFEYDTKEEIKTLRYGSVILAVDADSVSGDTPLLLKDDFGNIVIKNIEDLTSDYKIDLLNNKEYGETNYQVWTDNKWTNIKHIMKHKVSKQMYRVITHTGCVDVTEDHSLLNEYSEKITPNECNIGTSLLHSFPLFEDNKIDLPDNFEKLDFESINSLAKKINVYRFRKVSHVKKIELLKNYKNEDFLKLSNKTDITEDEAYVMGLFLGDGHCKQSIRIKNDKKCNRFTWSISNCNYVLLAKARYILTKIYGNVFELREIKYRENSYAVNQRYQLELIGGITTKHIIDKYRNLFYYKDSKYIHSELLNANLQIRKQLFKGYYDADGLHNKTKPKMINVFTKITTQCIYTLCRSIGYLVSIDNAYNSRKKETYILNLSKDKLCRKPNKIKKIFKLEHKQDMYVYDLETENHHFNAGIGQMCLHNTDGLGLICSLILNFFQVFFPKLIEMKYIKIFQTPLIRAYPNLKKKFIEEFYTIDDYNEWTKKINVDDYKINYIKGLATHSNTEIKHMFKNYTDQLYKFTIDDNSENYFDIYFGNNADKRKIVLSNYEECKYSINKENKEISCNYQLNVNTKEFQLENIQRKMPHIIDGLNPARRKVLAGSILKFKKSNKKLKVFQLGGFIAEKMFYHHGSDSLNKTIINMAQNFIGARNIPILLSIGQFGTHYKGDDAGSPRYIDTKLNKDIVDLIYPSSDMNLLEYNIIDGEIGEPKYFIPIIPMVLLEDITLPSTGWKIELWARDYNEVIKNVKSMIKYENVNKLQDMSYFKNKFKGIEYANTVNDKLENILLGTYIIKDNPKNKKGESIIVITSLPPKMWIDPFVEKLESNEEILRVVDESSINDINIEITISKDTMSKWATSYDNKIPGVDFIIYNLKMYNKISHLINLYNIDNTVKEFSNYKDVILDWFIIRKDCYLKRIERESILLIYKIVLLENTIRFVESHEEYNLSKKKDEVIENILSKNKYVKLNKSNIDDLGNVKNEEIENMIINVNPSYNYLLNLSYRQMNKESYERLISKLDESKKRLEYLRTKDIYKTIWINEIDSLNKILLHGFKNGFYIEDITLFK